MLELINELTLEARVENLNQALAFIDDQLDAIDCPMKKKFQIDVAVEELFVNVAHYAYAPGTGNVTLRVEADQNPPSVVITFIDRGVPYDPLAKPDPDVSLSAEQREIGGLGIFMVKKSMDSMEYEYTDGQNILRIRKNF